MALQKKNEKTVAVGIRDTAENFPKYLKISYFYGAAGIMFDDTMYVRYV